jgi:hypothetical protein
MYFDIRNDKCFSITFLEAFSYADGNITLIACLFLRKQWLLSWQPRCSVVCPIVVMAGSLCCARLDASRASRPLCAQVQSAAYDRVLYVAIQFRGWQAVQGWSNNHFVIHNTVRCSRPHISRLLLQWTVCLPHGDMGIIKNEIKFSTDLIVDMSS